jgi:hypothetical protein
MLIPSAFDLMEDDVSAREVIFEGSLSVVIDIHHANIINLGPE